MAQISWCFILLFMDKRDWSDNFHCDDSSHLQGEVSTNIPSARGRRAILSRVHTHLGLSHDHKYRLDVDVFVSCFCFQEIILLFPFISGVLVPLGDRVGFLLAWSTLIRCPSLRFSLNFRYLIYLDACSDQMSIVRTPSHLSRMVVEGQRHETILLLYLEFAQSV